MSVLRSLVVVSVASRSHCCAWAAVLTVPVPGGALLDDDAERPFAPGLAECRAPDPAGERLRCPVLHPAGSLQQPAGKSFGGAITAPV